MANSYADQSGSIPMRNTATAEKDATLTERAQRVSRQAREVCSLVTQIEQRVWPAPMAADSMTKPSEPDALPWCLESAETSLRAALEQLNSIHARL